MEMCGDGFQGERRHGEGESKERAMRVVSLEKTNVTDG